MIEHSQQGRCLGAAAPSSPLREGRPSRTKQVLRQHPYRRVDQQRHVARLLQCKTVQCTATINGNGKTATLPAGLNGHHRDGTGVTMPELQQLLRQVAAGDLDPQTAAMQVHELGAGLQKVTDLTAASSWGQSTTPEEIVWAPGKTAAQIAIALQRLSQDGFAAMAARVTREVAQEVEALLPEVKYNAAARALIVAATGQRRRERLPGTVAIITGSSADDSTAEEARAAAQALGCYSYKLANANASVDGLHSILPKLSALQSAAVVIVVAGKDGALPAVIAGLVQSPVVAIPSSAGDGVVASGLGISMVGSDNGLAAALVAARILRAASRLRAQGAPVAS